MTILSVIKSVAAVIALEIPTQVFASTEREHVELKNLAQEMADRIALAHEWELLNTIETITGDGSTEDWPMPSDYERMLTKSQLWSSSLETALSPIPDRDRWLALDVQSFDFVINAWIIYAGQMHIKPAMANTVTAKYFYQSDLIISPETGSNKITFSLDDDTFRLNERLLKLGMIWQWRANKGLPYAEDLINYEVALEKLIVRDKGSRILRLGRGARPRDVNVSYPQEIVIP